MKNKSRSGLWIFGVLFICLPKGVLAEPTITPKQAIAIAFKNAEIGTNDFRISDMGTDGNANFDGFVPAVAYNSTNNEYLVVWSADDNTGSLVDGEFEVFGQRVNAATGAEVGTNDFRISDMGADGDANFGLTTGADTPSVAYNSTNNEYLVVWSGVDSTVGEAEVFGQRLNAVAGSEVGTNDFRISDMGPDGDANFDGSSARVAYNSTNNEYLVVWSGDDNTGSLVDGELEAFGQRINAATGAEVGTNDFRISDMGTDGSVSFRANNPDVGYNVTNNEYLVVWHGDDNTGSLVDGEDEVFGQRLNAADGSEVGTNDFRISDMGTDGNTGFVGANASVAYNSTNNAYLVVWIGDDNTSPLVDNEVEVFGQRLNAADGSEVGTNDFRISDMGTDGNTSFGSSNPAVAYNGANEEYLVTWNGDDNTGSLVDGENEIFGQRLNAADGAEIDGDFRISDMGTDGNADFDASQRNRAIAFNNTNNNYLVVFGGDDSTDEESEVFGQLLSDPECGNGVVEGSEACDDGNSSNTDACLNTCVAASCGDGFARTGVEGCDDGNSVNTDACLNTCVSATCGDGSVQADVEQCDNGGNNSDTTVDACRINCTNARCGDSVIDTGETCDDGNTTAEDGCDASCLSEEESAPAEEEDGGGGCSLISHDTRNDHRRRIHSRRPE